MNFQNLYHGISYINAQKFGYPSASEIISALPIVNTINKIVHHMVTNSSNMSEDELYNNINASKPVIVWLGEKYDTQKEKPIVWKDKLRK